MPSIDVSAALHAARHAAGGPDPITPAAIGAVPAARWLTGTGSPEGVVAAPVGTVWTDTAATFGAVEWTKMAGAGATGWRVTKGDTTADVTAASLPGGLAPIAGDFIRVRRSTDSGLTIEVTLASRASWPSPATVTLPSWARPGPLRSLASRNGATPSLLAYAGGTDNAIAFYSATSGSITFTATVSPALSATPWRTA